MGWLGRVVSTILCGEERLLDALRIMSSTEEPNKNNMFYLFCHLLEHMYIKKDSGKNLGKTMTVLARCMKMTENTEDTGEKRKQKTLIEKYGTPEAGEAMYKVGT